MVLFSHDELFKYAVMTMLKSHGFQGFATGDSADLEFMTGQHLSKGIVPLVVLDAPGYCGPEATDESVVQLRRQLHAAHPQAAIVQLALPNDMEFVLRAYRDHVRSVFPRTQNATDIGEAITLLRAFDDFTSNYFERQSRQPLSFYKRCSDQLTGLTQAPELSLALLNVVGEMFSRALTLIVTKEELVAERAIGMGAEASEGAIRAPKVTLPLTDDSIFTQVATTGKAFYGECNDPALREQLFNLIGTPRTERVLLLPFKSRGRVIALTYADFGDNAPTAAYIPLLEALATQAGLLFDEARNRK